MTSFTVTIQTCTDAFLSCSADPASRAVDTWKADDKSGRQRWLLTPSGAGPNSYVVTASGGRGSGPVVLGAAPDSTGVDLRTSDDGSGRQRWLFSPVSAPGETRIFTISIEAGLQRKNAKFLTFDAASGKFGLRARASASKAPKVAGAQLFRVLEVAAPTPTPAPAGKAPVYVGGAFAATQHDLAHDPAGWRTVAPRAGYWLHPMGMAVAKDGGWLPLLLSRFGVKKFVYEQDLLAWSDGTNPLQTNTPQCWADWLRQADPAFQCEFYAPWVAGDRLANLLDDTTNRYAQIRQRMDAAGYANRGYFFYAPPCPESILSADTLLNARRNGLCHVEHVVRTAGLRGIAIDFPAGLWLSAAFPANFPPGSADKCRALARQAHDVARRCGVPFVWVLNGADACVPQALASIRAAGLWADVFAVDNFAAAARRGTPESDPNSAAGQALAVLRALG